MDLLLRQFVLALLFGFHGRAEIWITLSLHKRIILIWLQPDQFVRNLLEFVA